MPSVIFLLKTTKFKNCIIITNNKRWYTTTAVTYNMQVFYIDYLARFRIVSTVFFIFKQ